MVTSVGDEGSAPSPGWLLRAAAASCVGTLVALRAATLDAAVESLEVTVDSESDDRGILGIDPAVPAVPLSLRVAVLVHARAPTPTSCAASWFGASTTARSSTPCAERSDRDSRRGLRHVTIPMYEARGPSGRLFSWRAGGGEGGRTSWDLIGAIGTARARLANHARRQGRRHRADPRLAPVRLRHRPHHP